MDGRWLAVGYTEKRPLRSQRGGFACPAVYLRRAGAAARVPQGGIKASTNQVLFIKRNEECLNEMRQSQRSDKDKLAAKVVQAIAPFGNLQSDLAVVQLACWPL